MFLLSTVIALPLLGLFSNAQPIDNTAPGIITIEGDLLISGLVPTLLPSFDASAIMTVTFPDPGPILPGQNIPVQQVATAPQVTITPANSSVATTGNFTLMMVDSFPFGRNDSDRQILHWLANFATLESDSPSCPSLNVSTDGPSALVVTDYFPPAPPVGTGVHRYVIMLFDQPASYSAPANLSTPNVGPDLFFHLQDFLSSSNLNMPIASMFFDVEAASNASVPTVSSSATHGLIKGS